jgi:hypothetical protein
VHQKCGFQPQPKRNRQSDGAPDPQWIKGLRRVRTVTTPLRRRELHTRVSEPVYSQIRRYAAAQQLTLYAAAERLLLVALDAVTATETTDHTVRDTLAQLVAKAEIVSAVADRALYGAMIGYAYARSAALRGSLPTSARSGTKSWSAQAKRPTAASSTRSPGGPRRGSNPDFEKNHRGQS